MVVKDKSFRVSINQNDASANKQYIYYITFHATDLTDAELKKYERKIKNFLDKLDGE